MNKSDSRGGGLLSRVARFVLHPSATWADLDSHMPGAGTEEDRQALKAAIERKRRNDFVRKREFDMLRAALRQRQIRQAGQVHPATPSKFQGAVSSQGVEKEKTIEKIAQIEAQMAQHWRARRFQGDGSRQPGLKIGNESLAGVGSGAVTRHLQARRPGYGWDDSTSQDFASLGQGRYARSGSDGSGFLFEASAHGPETQEAFSLMGSVSGMQALPQDLEDAAIAFSRGEDAVVEQLLRATVERRPRGSTARTARLMLLDVLRAQGRLEAFEEAAAEYADLYQAPAPHWSRTSYAPDSTEPVWVCPALLNAPAVAELAVFLRGGGPVKPMDWSELASADVEAVEALHHLLSEWVEKPVEFRFMASGVLRRRLKASTPSGRKENPTIWWHLRLALLRLMGRQEEFDLTALDYCVTYGVVPPPWEAPKCRFKLLEDASGASDPALADPEFRQATVLPTQLGVDWPAVGSDTLPFAGEPLLSGLSATESPQLVVSRLEGELKGDISLVIESLRMDLLALERGCALHIDCADLARIDFEAAGHLLQWLLSAVETGCVIEFLQVGSLVGALFHVVGVDEVVPVRLREY